MDGIHFADGFDTAERLAFGLGAPQLVTVVAGCLLAFALLHAPLPAAVAVPFAVVLVVVAAALGWLRVAGRPALDWTIFALRHLIGPRRGVLVVTREPHRQPAPAEAGARVHTEGARAPLRDTSCAAAAAPPRHAAASNIIRLPGASSRDATNPSTVRRGARRVVFFSLKGGTGRTTLSTEIAAWAATCDVAKQTVIVDCDLRSACVGTRLGLAHAGIADFAIASPDERRLDAFLTTHRSGLRALLGPSRSTNPDWPVTPPVLREVLRELDLSGASVVIVDVAPEMNALTVAALRAADDIYVVVVPSATGIHDAYRTTEQLRRLGLRDRLGYVVNRADGRVDVSVAMNDLGGQVVAEVPEDVALVDAENSHCPAVLSGRSAAAFELRRFAGVCAPATAAAAR
ncbi:MAG: hypothetical protein JOZ75_10740 [Candidatus Dormibacteraeota bacterium]|nr:hypothetical protein [Candidatus Dormibacteraeota bacterium]